jgi:hypothetical protein
MTLKDFVDQFDKENAIVLLEGKRKVIEADKDRLENLGKLLATRTTKIIFRSGNADGADYYFSKGVTSVNSARLQVITPYSKHRQKDNLANDTISIDTINIVQEPEVIYQSKSNKKTEKLIDRYLSGEIDKFSIKAAYIIRDTIKAIGTDKIKPATFGIFYDDLENPKEGGTGHTMHVCEQNNIPIINQNVWFKWLNE